MLPDARICAVQSLRANVDRQEALHAFHGVGLRGLAGRGVRGPLQRMAAAYVPFRLYRVQYDSGHAHVCRYFALEAVEGLLDLFEFANPPAGEELMEIVSRNCLAARLTADHACRLLEEKILRMLFQRGFFRIRGLNLQIEPLSLEFSMPYWLGFYGADGRLRCRVLDAVRRRMEGAKASTLFEHWLAT